MLVKRRIKVNIRLAVFTVIFLVLFARLGFWQLDREVEKATQIARLAENHLRPPIDLDKLDINNYEDLSGLRIESEGLFLEDKIFLRDNVIFQGKVGFEVLRVFRTEAGQQVLANFGFLQGRPDRTMLPDIAELKAPRTAIGEVYSGPWMDAGGIELYSGWPRVTPTQDPLENSKALGSELAPFIVRIDTKHPDALPRYWPRALTKPEKHHAYAIQWFAMAVTLLIFFSVFTIKQNQSDR